MGGRSVSVAASLDVHVRMHMGEGVGSGGAVAVGDGSVAAPVSVTASFELVGGISRPSRIISPPLIPKLCANSLKILISLLLTWKSPAVVQA